MLPFTGFFYKDFPAFLSICFSFQEIIIFCPSPRPSYCILKQNFLPQGQLRDDFFSWLKSFWLDFFPYFFIPIRSKEGGKRLLISTSSRDRDFCGALCQKSCYKLSLFLVIARFILENFKFIHCTYMKFGICSWNSTLGLKYQCQSHNLCTLS